MIPGIHSYKPEKNIWAETDFENMGWHDASIHAISFECSDSEWTGDFLLDIDYIFKWVEPPEDKEHFSFWIAPCTLIFKKAYHLNLNIKTGQFGIDTQEIHELKLVDTIQNKDGSLTYQWSIELLTGHIQLTSEGFIQIVRQPPIYTNTQQLTQEQRGGISFAREPFI